MAKSLPKFFDFSRKRGPGCRAARDPYTAKRMVQDPISNGLNSIGCDSSLFAASE